MRGQLTVHSSLLWREEEKGGKGEEGETKEEGTEEGKEGGRKHLFKTNKLFLP